MIPRFSKSWRGCDVCHASSLHAYREQSTVSTHRAGGLNQSNPLMGRVLETGCGYEPLFLCEWSSHNGCESKCTKPVLNCGGPKLFLRPFSTKLGVAGAGRGEYFGKLTPTPYCCRYPIILGATV